MRSGSDTRRLRQQIIAIPTLYFLHPLMIRRHMLGKSGIGFTVVLSDMQGNAFIVQIYFHPPTVVENLDLFPYILIRYAVIAMILRQLDMLIALDGKTYHLFGTKGLLRTGFRQ